MTLPPLRNPSWTDMDDSKNKLALDNPSLAQKFKYEQENKKLLKDFNSLSRNYEALTLKQREDANLIRKLKQEIEELKNKYGKENNDNNNNNIDSLKEKAMNELQNQLDYTIQQMKSERKKFIEEISGLKIALDRLRNAKDTFAKTNSQNEEEGKKYKNLYDDVNRKNESNLKLIKNLRRDLERENNKYKEILATYENLLRERDKMTKENQLLYQSLEESRDKERKALLSNDELKKKLTEKPKKYLDIESKYKELLKKYDELKNHYEILLEEKNFLDNNNKCLMDELMSNNNKKTNSLDALEFQKVATFTILRRVAKKKKTTKPILSINKQESFDILTPNRIKQFENLIQVNIINEGILIDYQTLFTEKAKSFSSKLEVEILYLSQPIKNIQKEDTNVIQQLKEDLEENFSDKLSQNITYFSERVNNTMYILETKINRVSKYIPTVLEQVDIIASKNAKLKSENDYLKRTKENELKKQAKMYEEKLDKKRNKKYTLKNEIQGLKKEIDNLIKNKPDLSAVKQLFTEINVIIKRIMLLIETLEFPMKCHSCDNLKSNMNILRCGHSICSNCFKDKQELVSCPECHMTTRNNELIENIAFSLSIAKFAHAKQSLECDLNMILNRIETEFKKEEIYNKRKGEE